MNKQSDSTQGSLRMLMNMKDYSPVRLRRNPSPKEEQQIKQESSKVFPDLIRDPGESIYRDLASPTKQALLAALGSFVTVGGGVKAAGGSNQAALISSLATASLASTVAYLYRQHRNDVIVDEGLRMPTNATRRDLELNPVLQMEDNPEGLEQTARLHAAMKGLASQFKDKEASLNKEAVNGRIRRGGWLSNPNNPNTLQSHKRPITKQYIGNHVNTPEENKLQEDQSRLRMLKSVSNNPIASSNFLNNETQAGLARNAQEIAADQWATEMEAKKQSGWGGFLSSLISMFAERYRTDNTPQVASVPTRSNSV